MQLFLKVVLTLGSLLLSLTAQSSEKANTRLYTLKSKFLGAPVVFINGKMKVYDSLKKNKGWDVENALYETLPLIGVAHCVGGSKNTDPILFFDSSKHSKILHTVACSNISDWLTSEKLGTKNDPFDRAIVVLQEQEDMIQVALSPALYNNNVTQKKMMTEFPSLKPWKNIYFAWINRNKLSPLEKVESPSKMKELKKLMLSQYDLEKIKNPDILVNSVHEVGNEIWLGIEISVINTDFKRNAFAPFLDSNGKIQFKIAEDGNPDQ